MIVKFLGTTQTSIFLIASIIALIISTIQYKSIKVFFIQIVIYYLVLEDITCKLKGGCVIASWLATLVPLAGLVIFVLDYFAVFKDVRDKIEKVVKKYEDIKVEDKLDFRFNNKIIPI